MQNKMLDTEKFSKFLWGDVFYNIETRKFQRKSTGSDTPRSFVHFVLEPFYKMISLSLTSDKHEMQRILKLELGGIDKLFQQSDFGLSIKPFLKLVLARTFGNKDYKSIPCLVNVMRNSFINAKDAMKEYVDRNYLN